jgi:N-methylhydantoinase B
LEGRAAALDSVLVDMIGSHLMAIAEEMGIALVRASYSSNIKERRDCSTALLDADGATVAQAEHMPLHLGSMLGAVPRVTARYGAAIRPGDLYIVNDPFEGGGTHLPDITVLAPVFARDRLIAFAATVAHHTEVGGALTAPVDIYTEGLRIPPIRIFHEGTLDDAVLDFILLNCRHREERLGDLRAQFAASRLGVKRMAELADKYGAEVLRSAIPAWLDKAERQARRAIEAMPCGRYDFEDYMDDDGRGSTDLGIRVTLEIGERSVALDFAGSHPQVAGAINVVRSALLATVYHAVKIVIDPDLPANAGFYRVIEVEAEPRSLVDARAPAPVLWRSDTCQRIVDVVLGAFAQAVPERVVAACNGAISGVQLSGWHDDGRFFSYLETLGGGFGARISADGPDAVHAHMSNSSNLPVEALEQEYPLRVERYELREGSGGVGRFRGGLGVIRELRLLGREAHYRSKGDRVTRQPWGLFGGGPGAAARFELEPHDGPPRTLASKEPGLVLHAGDLIRICTPGGGGYGPVAARDPELVAKDLLEDKSSEAGAEAIGRPSV